MKRIILTLIIVIFILNVVAQELSFKHLKGKDGLLSERVSCIIQDSEGFVWIGTGNGLSRYNGYSFLNYTHSDRDSNSLIANSVTCMVEDHQQNLWIGTSHGLNKLNRATLKVERINSLFSDTVSSIDITDLCIYQENLWVATYASGSYCIDIHSDSIIQYIPYLEVEDTSRSYNVNCFLEDNNHNLLAGTNKGLYVFNSTNRTFTNILKNVDVRNLSHFTDSSIFVSVVSPNHHYFSMDKAYNSVALKLPIDYSQKEAFAFLDSGGNQWISVKDHGLIYRDKRTGEEKILSYNKYNSQGINSNVIICILEDKWGNIWFGSYDSGISMLDKNSKSFGHVKDNFSPTGLGNNRVRSIYQDSQGDIWIGTKVNGALSKYNTKNQTFQHFKHDPTNKHSLSNDFVFCITEDKPGFLWVGTSNGLNYFNKSNGQFERRFHESDSPDFITANNVYALQKHKHRLFIGHAQGLDIFNEKTKKIKHFGVNNLAGLSDHRVGVIYIDSKEKLWLGTARGLNYFDKLTQTFTPFLHQVNDSSSIASNFVSCIHEDANQVLWIGTSSGLSRYNRKNQTFRNFTTDNGLSGNTIKGILHDDQGNLWVSTNSGLSKFNPETLHCENYNFYDGLQGNEFTASAHCKTEDGSMLFGGNNGFNVFYPEQIKANQNLPNVVLTNFQIANTDVTLDTPDSPIEKHISQCKEITLNHKQSVITFEYVALNYSTPEKNEYAYKMEGFDSDWSWVGTRRNATYTNLSAGSYVFRVKASNNDGYWNEEGTRLHIKVLPPPWFSWWAIIAYILLFLLGIVLLWNYSLIRDRRKKEKEQNQRNLQFFVNLSHELRTPLTLILNLVTRLQSSGNKEAMEIAGSLNLSANKLMNLVNQLLDFRKTSLGHFNVKYSHDNVVAYCHKTFNLFKEVAHSKGIRIEFKAEPNNIMAYFDTDKLEKILANLLSNAIKYTQNDGEVELSITTVQSSSKISFAKTTSQNCYKISVKDTGIGLSEQQTRYIFDRFYSKDQTNVGAGIGLNFSKSLVELLEGSIWVDSKLGVGSTFNVLLPIKPEKLDKYLKEDKGVVEQNEFGNAHIKSLEYDILSETETGKLSTGLEDESKQKILVVEDNSQLRTQLLNTLSERYLVIEAANGKEGIEKIETHQPDLVISDVMMPEMDGVEMCSLVKSKLETSHIPVILLTAKSLIEHEIEGLEVGADDYIAKPFVMQALQARIKNRLLMQKRIQEKFLSSHTVLPAHEFTSNKTDAKFIEQVTKIALENISNPEYKASDIKDELKLSTTHFYNKIKSLTGQNPSGYLRTLRLQYAAELITKNEISMKEVCYKVGFNSPSYFTKTFREAYGKTPVEYSKETH